LPLLITLVVVSGLLTMISTPVWLSWMADLVPTRIRGRFFSRRNMLIAVSTLVTTIIGSLILDWGRTNAKESTGFAIVLLLGVAAAGVAWKTMTKLPAWKPSATIEATRWSALIEPLTDRPFRRVLIVFAMWNAAIGLSAAFFAPHMLTNLKMSFLYIGVYSCIAAISGVTASRAWGQLIDRYGSKPILNLSAFGIALIPLIWLFPEADTTWLLIPEAVYSGFLWAGFNVAAFTLPLDRSPRRNRSAYLSIFASVTGLAFFGASLLAGAVADRLSNWHVLWVGFTLINYHLLFVVSAIARLATAILIAWTREPDEVRLPIVIQMMGYAVLRRMSISRQLLPIAGDTTTTDLENNNRIESPKT
jgi:MFS family permease